MRILIIDDDDRTRSELASQIRRHGHTVHEEKKGMVGLEAMIDLEPHMVMFDPKWPNASCREVMSKVRSLAPDRILVLLIPSQLDQSVAEALKCGANNYLSMPSSHEALVDLLGKYDELITTKEMEASVVRLIFRRLWCLRVENRLDLVAAVARFLVGQAGDAIPEAKAMSVELGLSELLSNAMEHGNLEVTSDEKGSWLKKGRHAYHEFLTRRAVDPRFASRRVAVEMQVDGEACLWTITDEGPGFDFHHLPDPTEPKQMLRPYGRGIFIARMAFDEIWYEGKGNCVKVRLRIPQGEDDTTAEGPLTNEPSASQEE